MMKKVEVLILLALAAQMASGQWKQAPRPTFIPSISVLGSDNDYVYAATQNAFYRSLRGFYDWHRLDLPLSAHSLTIRTLAAENNRVIIGTNEGEVYGSDDAGLTWKKMAPGFSFGAVWSIVLKNGSVIVGSDKGIFVSNDRGNTWNASRLTGDGISVMTLLFFNDMIFAGTFGSGMFVSTDGGEQWVTADSGLTFPNITSLARKGNSIYAGTDDYFSDSVPVYESTDGGISWHEMSHGLPRPTHSRFVSFATEGSRLFAGTYGAGVYEFSERDSSWTSLNKGLMDYDLLTSSLLFDEGTILVANSNGVFKLDNADSTWVPVTKGLQMEEREILALARRDHLLLAGVNGNIYRSSNLGNDWQKATIVGTPGPATLCFLFHEDVIFAGTSYSLFRSLDNGISWHYAINGMGTPALTKQGPRVFASSADFYFHPFNSTVYVSENKGNTWSNSQFGSLSFRYVQALTSTPQHVFATSRNTVFRSDDGGLEWTSLKDALADSVSITRLHVVGDSLLAGTYDGIYISSDQGETWKSVSEGLPPKTAV